MPLPDRVQALALHGITANGLSWARVAHHLPGRVTLAAPDLRGQGRSGRVPGPYGIPVRADDMAAVVDTLGVERVGLTGHSMGAVNLRRSRAVGRSARHGRLAAPAPAHGPRRKRGTGASWRADVVSSRGVRLMAGGPSRGRQRGTCGRHAAGPAAAPRRRAAGI
ncbi:alpha/beta fold hydrolase [Streptomyces sp. NPDC001852]|uniref:alpha/beta fold hydrolase n=1 Tax=Streptomyces sp. NPDC001852 TaxID=3364619 RepID=UPI0036CC24D9